MGKVSMGGRGKVDEGFGLGENTSKYKNTPVSYQCYSGEIFLRAKNFIAH
jgi:hypothetical protein